MELLEILAFHCLQYSMMSATFPHSDVKIIKILKRWRAFLRTSRSGRINFVGIVSVSDRVRVLS